MVGDEVQPRLRGRGSPIAATAGAAAGPGTGFKLASQMQVTGMPPVQPGGDAVEIQAVETTEVAADFSLPDEGPGSGSSDRPDQAGPGRTGLDQRVRLHRALFQGPRAGSTRGVHALVVVQVS